MKRFIRLMILMLVSGCSSVWASKANVVQFGAIRVQLSLEAAPAVSRSGGTTGAYGSGGVSFVNKRWLVVHVSFVPGVVSMQKMAKNAGNQRGIQGLNGRWIDDVNMRVRVAFPSSNARKSNVVYSILEGQTTFWTLRLDGKRHTAVMFVPPQLIDRYASTTSAGRREMILTPADYRVLVEFSDSRGNFLGRATERSGNKNLENISFFESLVNSPATMVVKGAVLPRNKSPWAWHMPSTFDYIKDTGNDTGKN